jgi:hypothetical protein
MPWLFGTRSKPEARAFYNMKCHLTMLHLAINFGFTVRPPAPAAPISFPAKPRPGMRGRLPASRSCSQNQGRKND